MLKWIRAYSLLYLYYTAWCRRADEVCQAVPGNSPDDLQAFGQHVLFRYAEAEVLFDGQVLEQRVFLRRVGNALPGERVRSFLNPSSGKKTPLLDPVDPLTVAMRRQFTIS